MAQELRALAHSDPKPVPGSFLLTLTSMGSWMNVVYVHSYTQEHTHAREIK